MSRFLVVALAIAAGAFYLLHSLYQLCLSPDKTIPGPWRARLTRLWYFSRVRAGSFHHENIALHKKYGSIVRVAPGFYSISSPDKAVYGIGSRFPKGDWYQGWKHPSPDRWTLFPDQDMKRHADTRKRFQGLYSMSSLLSYESYVDDCVDLLVEKFRHFSESRHQIDLAHWFQCYAFDVMGKITYSERFGFLDDGVDIAGTISALDSSMVYSTLVGIFPALHPILYRMMEYIPGTGAAGRTYLMNFVQQMIDERTSARKGGKYKAEPFPDTVAQDFLGKLTDAHDKDPQKVTPYHIFMMGLSNIIAGSDTTAVSLSSVLYYLITSPESLARLREEVRANYTEGQKISFKETQEMPFLQDVIKEALRMHPATGLPLWRVVPEGGAHVAGRWLPAGTNVGINSWVAHNDESVYGEDAHTFRPDRWAEARRENGDRLKRMEANYMPFGLGSRTCLGRHISMLEMSKLVPELVRLFDFDMCMPEDQWKTSNYWFVKPEKLPVAIRVL